MSNTHDFEIYKSQLISNFDEIIDDIFSTESNNPYLKEELPLGTIKENLHLVTNPDRSRANSRYFPDDWTELKGKIVHSKYGEIGWCSLVWDEKDEICDDFFVLY